ncbi:MAG: hypothetical protein MRECE_53c001 [Mycoplasmataceae bacterium CE_OT135]|nr:MAG: hypothetical protein MRECE_53c001 [Mycoplasmataceae bacterium CE_OT135]
MKNWVDIHPNFGKHIWHYQQKWEEAGLTYQDAQEWITMGFEPEDYWKVKQWKHHNFTPQQAQSWIETDLKPNEYEFAAYLRGKGYQPNQTLNLEQLKEEFKAWEKENKLAQEYLDCFYPQDQRNTIKILNIREKNLTGNLDLRDFVNLEDLNCANNQLTSLILTNLGKLWRFDCNDNKLTDLQLTGCSKLKELHVYANKIEKFDFFVLNSRSVTRIHFSDNPLTKIDGNLNIFKEFINLEELGISKTSFGGSLESLRNNFKLWRLDISDTDINSGLEYLPDSLENFNCSADERKEAKCQTIYNLFANDQGKVVATDYDGRIINFSQKIQDYKQWRKLNFSETEIKQWINVGLTISEYEFANYLRQKGYQLYTPNIKEIVTKESWRDIHQDFSYSIRKEWENKDFNKEQTKEWIDAGFQLSDYNYPREWESQKFAPQEVEPWITAGAKLDDYEFVAWLRDIKKETPEWVTNYQEDYQTLSERFKKYGLCSECKQLNTGEQWCQPCNNPRLQKKFSKWTSHNPQIDEFIQKYQLAATDADKFIEWIPYEQFTNIEYLAEGGFGKVYKAKWKKGPIEKWEKRLLLKNKWKKKGEQEVVLKSLTNSQDNTDFLDETAKHKDIDDWFNNIVPCYGLSQDPQTGNYLMVMQYMPEGNLRKYLSKKNKELTLKDKLSQLVNISRGLKDLHQKNLIHRDFHSGNILKGIEKTSCLITDLGLCKPADETNEEEKIFGVMPYVAPEVLNSKPYTQASDIYSFGIVAYEILSGLPPYYDKAHDIHLALEICQGLRPEFNIKIPQLLEDLINRCWDADPRKRPTANELEKILRNWEEGTSQKENNEYYSDSEDEVEDILFRYQTQFTQQLQEAEEYNKTLPENIKFPDYQKKIHKGATYHSKLLPTKEITQLLQKLKTSEQSWGSKNIELTLNNLNLDELNIQETQQSEQQALQVQPTNQPYGTPSSSKTNP